MTRGVAGTSFEIRDAMLNSKALCSLCPVHLPVFGRSRAPGCRLTTSSSKEFLGSVDSLKRQRLKGYPPSDVHPLEVCCCIADTRRLGPKKLESILTDEVPDQFYESEVLNLFNVRGRFIQMRKKRQGLLSLLCSTRTRSCSTLDSRKD